MRLKSISTSAKQPKNGQGNKHMKPLHEKHIRLVGQVNKSTTEADHAKRYRELRIWREGVEDAGRKLDLMACDRHYIDKGIDRPMCCGVWLDWSPLTDMPLPLPGDPLRSDHKS